MRASSTVSAALKFQFVLKLSEYAMIRKVGYGDVKHISCGYSDSNYDSVRRATFLLLHSVQYGYLLLLICIHPSGMNNYSKLWRHFWPN